jgi:hypothetical protein
MNELAIIYYGTLMISIAALAFGAWATAWNKGHWAFYVALTLVAVGAGAFFVGYDMASHGGLTLMAAAFVCFFVAGGLVFGLVGAWAVRRLRNH